MRIINGRRSEQTRWQIELAPKTGGEIRVPALSVGAAQTAPLTLTVTPTPPEVARRQGEQLFLETEIEPAGAGQAIYVQSQVSYTVRLFYALPLLDGALSDPQPADALVERLGEDRSYTIAE